MLRFALAGSLAACTSLDPPTSNLEGRFDTELRDGTLTLSMGLHDRDSV
jgi:hypothetical protein